MSVTLKNTGTASVAISQGSASGTGFSITGLAAQTLTAGQSTSFTAKFSPTTAGSATGSVSIVSNAPGFAPGDRLVGIGYGFATSADDQSCQRDLWQRIGGKHRIADGHADESGERRVDGDASVAFGHWIQHERREHADDD